MFRTILIVIAALFALFAGFSVFGCKTAEPVSADISGDRPPSAIVYADAARRAGLKGELTIIGGPGNVGPFFYNFLGLNWTLRVNIDPRDLPPSELLRYQTTTRPVE